MDCTDIALCDACYVVNKSAEAGTFCFECKQKLCTECQLYHTRFPAMRDHRIVKLDELTVGGPMLEDESPKSTLSRCDSHERNTVTHFCYDHKEVYCNLCRAVRHTNCNEKPIADVCGKLGANDLTHIVENLDQLAGGLNSARQERQNQVDEMISMKNRCVEEMWDLKQRLHRLFYQLDANAHLKVTEVDGRVEEFSETAALYDDAMQHVLSLLGQTKELVKGCDRETIFAAQTKAQRLRAEYTSLVQHYKVDMQPMKIAFNQDAQIVDLLSTCESLGEVNNQITEATPAYEYPVARHTPLTYSMPVSIPQVTARIAPIQNTVRFAPAQISRENVQPQITAIIAPTCNTGLREMPLSPSSDADSVFSLENHAPVLPLPVVHPSTPHRPVPKVERATVASSPSGPISPDDSPRSLSPPQTPAEHDMAPSLFGQLVASGHPNAEEEAGQNDQTTATRGATLVDATRIHGNDQETKNHGSPRDSPRPDHDWRNIRPADASKSKSSTLAPLFSQIHLDGEKRVDRKTSRNDSSSSSTSDVSTRTTQKGFKNMVLKRQQRVYIGVDSDKGVCDTTGLTFLKSGQLIICDYFHKTIKALDKDFKLICYKRLADHPWDATELPTTEIAVTMSKSKKVQFLTLESTRLSVTGSYQTKQMCWGIGAFHDCMLITFHDNPGNGAVELRSRKGEVLTRIPDESDQGSLFVAPIYIALDSAKEKCYVTDGKNKSVIMVDCTGSGGTEIVTKKDYLHWPKGIVIDEESNMIVSAHFANQLKLLKSKSKGQRNVGCTDFCAVNRPQALAFNWQTLTLVVGTTSEDKKIDVLTFEYR